MAMMASSNNYDPQVDDFEDDLIDPDDGNIPYALTSSIPFTDQGRS